MSSDVCHPQYYVIQNETGNEGAQVAATLLPGGTLKGVAGAVERCLRFYLDTGAITARTEAGLRRLLASLSTASAA